MRKIFEIILLSFLCISLCSCPYSSAYYLDEKPNFYVEDALVGKWLTFIKDPHTNNEEAVYLNLSKRTETEYNISFTGDLNKLLPFKVLISDSLSGTAFMSTVGNHQFFNININSRVYIAELGLQANKLSLLPLAESFTSKMILNSAALRKSVEVHYKTRVHPLMDNEFCLHDMIKVN